LKPTPLNEIKRQHSYITGLIMFRNRSCHSDPKQGIQTPPQTMLLYRH
jgi:hypothetical protein